MINRENSGDEELNGTLVWIVEDAFCSDCGWPIVQVESDDPDFRVFEDAQNFDYWCYCSNKICDNHEGEGINFGKPLPNWVNYGH